MGGRLGLKLTFAERLRSLFQDPFSVARRAGIREGQTVADVGAGNGFFTIAAAMEVGPAGTVYAVEPDELRSRRIAERASSEGLENVRVLMTTAEHLDGIKSGSVDVAFSAFSLHHFDDRNAGFKEIARILKQGGVFLVWDIVPSILFNHGTRPSELKELTSAFSSFEVLSKGRTVRAMYTK